ncbi:ABC transporter ATP-binding protein NatA [Alteriqipengyuania sp. 357]
MLTLRNVCKSYRTSFLSSKHAVALHPSTVGFCDGEVTGIVGPNGAGKSTLLKLASGIIPPDHGTISFEGEPISDERLRSRIGYVSNHVEPYPKMSIRQNLEFRGRIGGLDADAVAVRAEELAARFGILHLIDRSAGVLSTGEGQKLKLCSAMMLDPAVLILDEPTTGLDIVASAALFEVIEELKSDGRALVFCSHSPAELERLCDRFTILKKGRIVSRFSRGELGKGTDFEDNLLNIFKDNG